MANEGSVAVEELNKVLAEVNALNPELMIPVGRWGKGRWGAITQLAWLRDAARVLSEEHRNVATDDTRRKLANTFREILEVTASHLKAAKKLDDAYTLRALEKILRHHGETIAALARTDGISLPQKKNAVPAPASMDDIEVMQARQNEEQADRDRRISALENRLHTISDLMEKVDGVSLELQHASNALGETGSEKGLARALGGMAAEAREVRAALPDIRAQLKEISNRFDVGEFERKAREVDEHLEAAKRARETLAKQAVEQTISAYAVVFNRESSEHADAAKPWLRGTIALFGLSGAVPIVVLTALLFWDLTTDQLLRVAISATALFSLTVSAAVWCGKQYQIRQHNSVTNRHRANALSAYQAFADATTDGGSREALLTQASSAIFGHQATGFTDGQRGDGPVVIEMARSIVQPKE